MPQPFSFSSFTSSPIPGFAQMLYSCQCSRLSFASQRRCSLGRRFCTRSSACASVSVPSSKSDHSFESNNSRRIHSTSSGLSVYSQHTLTGSYSSKTIPISNTIFRIILLPFSHPANLPPFLRQMEFSVQKILTCKQS